MLNIDIFDVMYGALSKVSPLDIMDMMLQLSRELIPKSLACFPGNPKAPLFCAIDEGQVALSTYQASFLSEVDQSDQSSNLSLLECMLVGLTS